MSEQVDTGKVVRIDGTPVDQYPHVEQALVETLEMFLQKARAGEIRSVAIVGLYEDHTCLTYDHSGRGMGWIPLLGAISRLQHSVQTHLDSKPDLPI